MGEPLIKQNSLGISLFRLVLGWWSSAPERLFAPHFSAKQYLPRGRRSVAPPPLGRARRDQHEGESLLLGRKMPVDVCYVQD
jgi:hypothetical protein